MKTKLFRFASIFAFFLVWEGVSRGGIISPRFLPAPSAVFLGLSELLSAGLPPGYTLPRHILHSLTRVLSGFLLAAILAIPLGILLGWSQKLRHLLEPTLQLFRPIPPLAWIPIAVLWFGIGLKSAAFIIFLGAFFPILLNAIAGVEGVDPVLIKASRTLGAKDRDILFKVLTPGALPSIITGLRVGLGIGWMTLVAAEFTGVKSGYGLGYMIMTARDIQRPDEILAGMIVIGVIGVTMDYFLRLAEKKWLRWRG